MSGHVSSQSGTQLPGVSPQNGNVVPNMVAAGGGAPHAGFGMDADLLRARTYMQDKIFLLLAQRHHQQMNDSQMQKLKDIGNRLEEGLFKSAPSKEEYLNLSTLESRLHSLIKHPLQPTNANMGMDADLLRDRTYMQEKIFLLLAQLHHQQMNDSQIQKLKDIVNRLEERLFKSAPSREEYLNLSTLESRLHSLIKRPLQPTNANTGNLMSSGVMQSSSFNRTDGLLSNGYQQAQANYPIGSGGNNPVTDGCAENEQPDDSGSRIS